MGICRTWFYRTCHPALAVSRSPDTVAVIHHSTHHVTPQEPVGTGDKDTPVGTRLNHRFEA